MVHGQSECKAFVLGLSCKQPQSKHHSVDSRVAAVTKTYKQHSQGFFTLRALKHLVPTSFLHAIVTWQAETLPHTSQTRQQSMQTLLCLQHPPEKGPHSNAQEDVCPCSDLHVPNCRRGCNSKHNTTPSTDQTKVLPCTGQTQHSYHKCMRTQHVRPLHPSMPACLQKTPAEGARNPPSSQPALLPQCNDCCRTCCPALTIPCSTVHDATTAVVHAAPC